MKKFDRPWLIAIAVLPLALTLGGCSLLGGGPNIPNVPGLPGDGSGGDGDGVEEVVEGAGGGDIDYEEGSLPADFPVADIPLVPGEIVIGMSMGGSDGRKAWQVNIKVADQSVAETADDLLLDAGFSNESGFAFENDTYLVVVTAQDTSEGWQVAYIISETE